MYLLTSRGLVFRTVNSGTSGILSNSGGSSSAASTVALSVKNLLKMLVLSFSSLIKVSFSERGEFRSVYSF